MDWNDCGANQAPDLMRILDISARHLPETRQAMINQNTFADVFGVVETEGQSETPPSSSSQGKDSLGAGF